MVAMLLLCNCSQDKGNYDYTEIDDVTISLPASLYNVISGGNLKITPTLEHSLKDKQDELSYAWEIDGNVVSNELNLDIMLPAMSYGTKDCALIVTDETTGMKFYKSFEIEVVGEISVGYYFLTEDDQNKTLLSFLPVATETNPNPEVIHTKACGDLEFSSTPISITGMFSAGSLAGYGIWSIIILTKDGENNCIVTDGNTFLPSTTLSTSNFVEQNKGYTFNAQSCITSRQGKAYFISNGQFVYYNKGLLYRPAEHSGTYQWSYPIPSSQGYNFFFVYDGLSHKFYVIKPLVTNAELGIVGDSNAFDDVVEIENSPDLSNEDMIGTYMISGKGHYACTATREGIHLHSFSNTGNTSYSYDGETLLPVENADGDTKAIVANNTDWYFFVGNKIYTSPVDLPKLSDFLTIPEEYGKVTSVHVSAKASRLIVTTYNENSSAELKGSILFIDIYEKQIIAHKNVIHKCISCLGANDATNPYYEIGGDGF